MKPIEAHSSQFIADRSGKTLYPLFGFPISHELQVSEIPQPVLQDLLL